jgi:hypothetical protein
MDRNVIVEDLEGIELVRNLGQNGDLALRAN